MNVDKNTAGRRVRFALPASIGEVVYGVDVDEGLLMEVLGRASGCA
jgi:hypothetical protein